jgi:uncharacterized membrane protein YeaQ/YmgE (transglycosylase-associated protein family)
MHWLVQLILWILFGALAGWIAGKLMGSKKNTFWWNFLFGIVGSVVGGWIAGLLGIGSGNWIIQLLIAVGGACLVLFLVGLFTKDGKKKK